MCAIIGCASTNKIDDKNWLRLGCDLMKHRGPDSSGEWWSENGRIGLAHRRLAILDLSKSGYQPMSDEQGKIKIVFNGEIYNYREIKRELQHLGCRFYSDSDTEVLLAAYRHWGEECLNRINGMFAFAIVDQDRRILLLARDRAGEKPLYYWARNGAISFASELKALMLDKKLERRVSPFSLDCFLGLGFVPGNQSILKNVNKLPPAHALRFNLSDGATHIWRYWMPPETASASEFANEPELVLELETLLRQAVNKQLIADVGVGLLLSGGIDSGIIAGIAAQSQPNLRSFTVRFPGGGNHDESDHARFLAQHFKLKHEILDAEPSSVGLLVTLANQFDEPMNDSSMVPMFLVSKVIRQHCSVAIGGDGGDELFGGYKHYDRMLKMQEEFGRIARPLRSFIANIGNRILPTGFKGKNWIQSLGVDFACEVPCVATYFDRRARRELLGIDCTGAEDFWISVTPRSGDLVQRATRIDFSNYLSEDILVKVDRASMLNSLEIRAPMLDQKVIEFAFNKVPSRFKATSSARKILLRGLAEKLLPTNYNLTRKQGFSIPIAKWLESGPWLDFFKEILFDHQQDVFKKRYIEKLFEGQAAGRLNGERLFGLVFFELWRRNYKIIV